MKHLCEVCNFAGNHELQSSGCTSTDLSYTFTIVCTECKLHNRHQFQDWHNLCSAITSAVQVLKPISWTTFDGVSERNCDRGKRNVGHHMSQSMADGDWNQQLDEISINRLQCIMQKPQFMLTLWINQSFNSEDPKNVLFHIYVQILRHKVLDPLTMSYVILTMHQFVVTWAAQTMHPRRCI